MYNPNSPNSPNNHGIYIIFMVLLSRYERMTQTYKFRPDKTTMGALVKTHSTPGDSVRLLEFIHRMKFIGLNIPIVSFRLFISALAALGDLDAMLGYFLQSEQSKRVSPDVKSVGIMINAYTQA